MKAREAVAEFLGTFALCFIGYGVCHFWGKDNIVAVALGFGLVIAVFGTIMGPISGGHLNPAVTIALASVKRFPAKKVLPYVAVQVVAAILAGIVLKLVCSPHGEDVLRNAVTRPNFGAFPGFLAELIGTMFLVLAIFGTAVDERSPKMGAFLIGCTIVFLILVIGPLTGGALNPARFLGSNLGATQESSAYLIYTLGPISGALIGALIYDKVLAPEAAQK